MEILKNIKVRRKIWVLMTILNVIVAGAYGQIRVGDPGVIFDETKFDSNYPQIEDWITAGVVGGIPPLSEYPLRKTVSPMAGVELRAAIQEVADAGKGHLLMLDGIYTIDATITIPSNVRLVGESKEGTILRVVIRGSDAVAFQFTGAQYAGIENLTIEGYYNGEIPPDFTMSNNRTDFVVSSVYFPSNSENCWIQNCNILNSGNHAITSWNCNNITIRDCYIERSWNKGEGGRGYIQISGDHMLFYNNVVKKMRHLVIQRSGSFSNVFYKNYMEQDFNFHDSDNGNNLVEQNITRLPAGLGSSWHAMMGPWSIQHNISVSDNFIFLNDAIENNNGGSAAFSDNSVVYLGARDYESGNPFVTTSVLPSGGTFYPASNVVTDDAKPDFDKFFVYTEPEGDGSTTISPENIPYHSASSEILINAVAKEGSQFRYWKHNNSIEPNLSVTVDENSVYEPVFTKIGDVPTWVETFEKYTEEGPQVTTFVGNQQFEWSIDGIKGSDLGSETSITLENSGSIGADAITGGISKLTFDIINLSNDGVARIIEVAINNEVIHTENNSSTTEFTLDLNDLNVSGEFSLEIRNSSLEGNANFAVDNVEWTAYDAAYDLDIQSNHGEVSQTPFQPQYDIGQIVVLEAEAYPGQQFLNWSGDATSSENPISITIAEENSIIANYTSLSGSFSFVETFDRLENDNPFHGEYRIQWDISGSKTQLEGSGNAVELPGNGNIISGTLERGISSFSVDVVNLFGFGISRTVELWVDHELVGQINDSGTAKYSLELSDLEYIDPVKIEIKNNSSASIIIDNLSWTNHDGIERYSLNTNNNHGKLTISPDELKYVKNTEVSITAQGDDWLLFTGWSGDFSGNENPKLIIMDEAKEINANYELKLKEAKIQADIITDKHETKSYINIDDLDLDSYWESSENGDYLEFQFENPVDISNVHLSWFNGEKITNAFEIHLSQNGTDFYRFLKSTSSGTTSSIQSFSLDSAARAIRYVVRQGADGLQTQLSEVIISGDMDTKVPLSVEGDLEISIYPNPTQGAITVNYSTKNTMESLSIWSITGNFINKFTNIQSGQSLDLSNLKTGVYIVLLKYEDSIIREKIILEK
ncbi:MAG: T9SS type A sorting domain-containing protein [Reichenbachiella sp.]|uniref:InlB B-repeat-containing protein n=1 Tax=Reichenbachiella sp. TaxID=2184521 RepID=UPI00329903B0